MKIYTADQAACWNQYVKSFRNWDVYYLCEYAISFMLHGDGVPLLVCYEDAASRMCYVVMKRDISDDARFGDSIEKNKYFDLETPYGYGGPLVDGPFPAHSQQAFLDEFSEYCKSEHIVSQFVRFHPLLNNHEEFSMISENHYLHDTIFIDTVCDDLIFSNMCSSTKNKVRKGYRAGIQVINRPMNDYAAFFDMYYDTMRQHDANKYYYFHEKYFAFLKDALKENAAVFYAMLDNKPIAGAVFLFNEKTMHYHLASTVQEYRGFAAGNLLLYEAAIWAAKNGIDRLHLGGGLNENDSLFEFKRQFNKSGRLPFYIGRTVFCNQTYDWLLQLRIQLDPEFDVKNPYLIQYRR